MKLTKVALLGFGTVGQSVVKGLRGRVFPVSG